VCRTLVLAFVFLFGGCAGNVEERPRRIRVFCAASASAVIEAIPTQFERDHPGVAVEVNAAASSTLARQIEAGARCDLYISANELWMDELAANALINPETRINLLGNRLVLIAHRDDEIAVEANTDEADLSWLGDERIALGDPAHVPAGRYAQQSLTALDWWSAMEAAIVPCGDVRAALQFVETQQTRFGIVYATDARGSDRVRVVITFDDALHDPITYPAALTTEASDEAAELLLYLQGAVARSVFRDAGFAVRPSRG